MAVVNVHNSVDNDYFADDLPAAIEVARDRVSNGKEYVEIWQKVKVVKAKAAPVVVEDVD